MKKLIKIGYTDMGDVDWNLPQRNAYLLGYDQAMQAFLEKAERAFIAQFNSPLEKFERFKNYIKNEM